jgi:hypothetical protein
LILQLKQKNTQNHRAITQTDDGAQQRLTRRASAAARQCVVTSVTVYQHINHSIRATIQQAEKEK